MRKKEENTNSPIRKLVIGGNQKESKTVARTTELLDEPSDPNNHIRPYVVWRQIWETWPQQ